VLFNTKDASWKIADFGITEIFTSRSTRTTKYYRGTENYLAPEVLEHGLVTRKSDIWGLGCILYELATSKAAFNGAESIRRYSISGGGLEIPPLPFERLRALFIADTIHEMLTLNPTGRPSAREVASKLTDNMHQIQSRYRREEDWISNGDDRLIPVKWLGSGSSGDVYEVLLLNI